MWPRDGRPTDRGGGLHHNPVSSTPASTPASAPAPAFSPGLEASSAPSVGPLGASVWAECRLRPSTAGVGLPLRLLLRRPRRLRLVGLGLREPVFMLSSSELQAELSEGLASGVGCGAGRERVGSPEQRWGVRGQAWGGPKWGRLGEGLGFRAESPARWGPSSPSQTARGELFRAGFAEPLRQCFPP